jgi:hypothetical protein
LQTASISPDLFNAPPPGNAISPIKEGFRDKSKHLRDRAPRGARTRARSRARSPARSRASRRADRHRVCVATGAPGARSPQRAMDGKRCI